MSWIAGTWYFVLAERMSLVDSAALRSLPAGLTYGTGVTVAREGQVSTANGVIIRKMLRFGDVRDLPTARSESRTSSFPFRA